MASHTWRFFRAGGFDQVDFETGADLCNLDQLDQKLWAALCCPTRGVEFDTRTLEIIDTDKDGRVRAPEVIAAAKWACSMLKSPDELLRPAGSLELSAINDATPEGKQLLASAKQTLAALGKSAATAVAVDDTVDQLKIFAATQFNGDGIISPESTDDAKVKAVISDIMATAGSETDRGGKLGLSQGKIDSFFAEAAAFSDWVKKSETDAAGILPLKEKTGDAFATLQAVRPKIDDYFARCRLAAFDSRAQAALNRQESEYLAIAAKDMAISAAEIAAFPLARIEAGRPLPLSDQINPTWAAAITKFRSAVVVPVLGERTALTEAEWDVLVLKFAAHEAWTKTKAGAIVEKLGVARIREILGSSAKETLGALVTKDKSFEPEANAIGSVEKLVRFKRDLLPLVKNFVSFEDFYARRNAIFQIGTLFLDGRSCHLCVPVADTGKHAALAGLAKTYLAYCDCSRSTGEKMTIAAAFTDGDSDALMVGRNGLFYDRKGRDWDATITRIIENPISIRQAFWSPYKKLVRLIEEQVAKRAAAAEAASSAKLTTAATTAANVDKTKPPEQKKVDVGTVAALGVAFGAIGTALATAAGYMAGVLKLPFWQVCLAFVGMLLVISGPSMLIAWLKLRQRNLGPILDANGWAVNGRVKMNVPFGGSLTHVAELPPNSQRSFDVRYPEPPTALPKLIFTIIAICFVGSLLNHFGLLYRITDGKFGRNPNAQVNIVISNTPPGTVTIETNTPAK